MSLPNERAGFAAYGTCSALSIAGCVVAMAALLATRRRTFQEQRILFAILLGHALMSTLDVHPPWVGWGEDVVWWLQVAVFQGARFALAGLEIFLLVYALRVLRTQTRFTPAQEMVGQTACWLLGCIVAAVSFAVSAVKKTSFDDDAATDTLWDALTYVWLVFVVLALVLLVALWFRVRRAHRGLRLNYDPDMDARLTFTTRTRVVQLRREVLKSLVRPVRIFPVIFVVSSVGELGLLILRHLDCEATSVVCEAFYYVCFCVVDIRGFLTALTYCWDRELWAQFRTEGWSSILCCLCCCGSCCGCVAEGKRGHHHVRFVEAAPLLPEPQEDADSAAPDEADDVEKDAWTGTGSDGDVAGGWETRKCDADMTVGTVTDAITAVDLAATISSQGALGDQVTVITAQPSLGIGRSMTLEKQDSLDVTPATAHGPPTSAPIPIASSGAMQGQWFRASFDVGGHEHSAASSADDSESRVSLSADDHASLQSTTTISPSTSFAEAGTTPRWSAIPVALRAQLLLGQQQRYTQEQTDADDGHSTEEQQTTDA